MASVAIEAGKTHSDTSCWNNCWNSFTTSKWNPKNWNYTWEKITKIAAIILASCIVVIAVSALLSQYPQALGAFYTIFGIISVASLIALVIGVVKHCQQNRPTAVKLGPVTVTTEKFVDVVGALRMEAKT